MAVNKSVTESVNAPRVKFQSVTESANPPARVKFQSATESVTPHVLKMQSPAPKMRHTVRQFVQMTDEVV